MIVTRYFEVLNLKGNPFSLTPDVRMFFLMRSHVEAADTVLFSYDNGVPMVRIYGEPGTGKTMLLKYLKERLTREREADVRYISCTPLVDVEELAREVLGEPRLSISNSEIVQVLKKRISERDYVVLIDEAQDMGYDHFMLLKFLIDEGNSLDAQGRFFVVCAGTMKLADLFDDDGLRPLAQRSPYFYTLKGLTKAELSGYIDYRLRQVGYTGEFPFSRWALGLMWKSTRGNPRRVNILAERSLLAAMVRGKRRVGRREVKEAIKDLPKDL